jgi:hypothetical protein
MKIPFGPKKKKLQNSILSKLITQIQLKKFISCKNLFPNFSPPPFQRTKRNPNSRVSELKKPKKNPPSAQEGLALWLAAATMAISPPRPASALQNPQQQNFTTRKFRGATPTTNQGKKRTKEMQMSRADVLNPKP